MDHINESTHRQLINVADTLAKIIDEIAMETSKPLNYARLSAVNKARDVSRMAKAEARLAGVPMDGGKAAIKATELPIGTIMYLGGNPLVLTSHYGDLVAFKQENSPNAHKLNFWCEELQELIDRGVRFILPEANHVD